MYSVESSLEYCNGFGPVCFNSSSPSFDGGTSGSQVIPSPSIIQRPPTPQTAKGTGVLSGEMCFRRSPASTCPTMPSHTWQGLCKPSSKDDVYHCLPGLHVRQTCRPSKMSGIWLVGDLFVRVLHHLLLTLCELAYKLHGETFPRKISRASLILCHDATHRDSDCRAWRLHTILKSHAHRPCTVL